MTTVDLRKDRIDLEAAMQMARTEPVLLLAPDGREFCLAEADDFEKEVNALRSSEAFQHFLDERRQHTVRFSLDEVEAEIDRELVREDGVTDTPA